jgi:hypothetical protein
MYIYGVNEQHFPQVKYLNKITNAVDRTAKQVPPINMQHFVQTVSCLEPDNKISTQIAQLYTEYLEAMKSDKGKKKSVWEMGDSKGGGGGWGEDDKKKKKKKKGGLTDLFSGKGKGGEKFDPKVNPYEMTSDDERDLDSDDESDAVNSDDYDDDEDDDEEEEGGGRGEEEEEDG